MITTALELAFGDGDYLFDLKLPQLAELQRLRGPIFTVYARVLKGRYQIGEQIVIRPEEGEAHAEDLFETIRLALVGGGRGLVNEVEVEVSALTAKRLVETYCHPQPLQQSWGIAAAILAAKVQGYQAPEKKSPEPDATETQTPSTSPKRSRRARQSASTGAS